MLLLFFEIGNFNKKGIFKNWKMVFHVKLSSSLLLEYLTSITM